MGEVFQLCKSLLHHELIKFSKSLIYARIASKSDPNHCFRTVGDWYKYVAGLSNKGIG